MDADGYFYFMDRVKDYIRRRGENVSSMEVEKVVNDHPQIKEGAAIGVKAGEGASSEDEIMIVCIAEGEALDPVEFTHWLAERMPYFMVPRYIRFVAELPKTLTERVQKVSCATKVTADTLIARPPASRSRPAPMAQIIRYGAYLPRYQAPLARSRACSARPAALQEPVHAGARRDRRRWPPAPRRCAGGGRGPRHADRRQPEPRPFGLRKLSATLARALGLAEVVPLGGWPLRGAARRPGPGRGADGRRRAAGAGGGLDHLVSHDERVADTLSAGGAAASWWAPFGASPASPLGARAGREVYDVWRLGTPSLSRATASRCSSTPTRRRRPRRWRRWRPPPSGPPRPTRRFVPASPTPRPCAGWAGRA